MKMCWEAMDHLDLEESFNYRTLEILEIEMKAATFLELHVESHNRWILAQIEHDVV